MKHLTNIKSWGFGSFIEDDETVLRVFRQPFVLYFGRIFFRLIIWGSLAAGVWFFFPQLMILWIGLVLWALFRAGSIFGYWYVNGIIMTDIGVVFVDWPKFFERRYHRIDYFDLDQIGVEKIGFKAFLNNFGTMQFVKVGGDITEVHNINRPNRTARIIENYKEKAIDEKNFTEESALKGLLSQIVLTHVKKDGQPERDIKISDLEMDSEGDDIKFPAPTPTQPPTTEKAQRRHHGHSVDGGTDVDIEKILDDSGGIDIDFEEEEQKR